MRRSGLALEAAGLEPLSHLVHGLLEHGQRQVHLVRHGVGRVLLVVVLPVWCGCVCCVSVAMEMLASSSSSRSAKSDVACLLEGVKCHLSCFEKPCTEA